VNKKLVSAAAAIVLLLGGGGAYGLFSDNQNLPAAPVSSGKLLLNLGDAQFYDATPLRAPEVVDGNLTWGETGTIPVSGEDFVFSPGDLVQVAIPVQVTLAGENLAAKVTTDLESHYAARGFTVAARLVDAEDSETALDAPGVGSKYFSDDGTAFVVTEIGYTGGANDDSQVNLANLLDGAGVTLTQVHRVIPAPVAEAQAGSTIIVITAEETEGQVALERALGGGMFTRLTDDMGTEYVDRGLTPNTNYLYRIQECDGDVCSDWNLTPASTEKDATVFVSDMPAGAASLPISGAQAGTIIDWGDGNVQTLTASATSISHTYAAAGVYTVTITGPHTGIWNQESENTFRTNLIEMRQIASTVTNLSWLFRCYNGFTWGCGKLSPTAMANSATWDTSAVTSMEGTFAFAMRLIPRGIGNWDTSAVTNMRYLFGQTYDGLADPPAIPESIGNWDTSAVTNMNQVFYRTYYDTKNPPALPNSIGNWDTSAVTTVSGIFYRTYLNATWPNSTKPASGPDLHCWAVPKPSSFDTDFGLTWPTELQPFWGASYPVC